MRALVAGLILTAGCGRFGFGPGDPAADGAVTSDSTSDDAAEMMMIDARPPPLFSNSASVPNVPLADVTVDMFRWLSTDSGAIYDTPPDLRSGGTGVVSGMSFEQVGGTSILALESLTIPSGVTLRPKGTKALIIVVRGDIVIEEGAFLDASGNPAGGFVGGPGGFDGGSETAGAGGCGGGGSGTADTTNGAQPTAIDGGGAGGSYATAGADGSSVDGEHGLAADVCPVSFEPLIGGSGGGAGALEPTPLLLGGRGGGGGGALQLSAGGRIVINGSVSVSGGGGGDGGTTAVSGTNWGGGGGGGAGGVILLEAHTIIIGATGSVTANGGGGGADLGVNRGGTSYSEEPAPGSTGSDGATIAGGKGCSVATMAARGGETTSTDGAGGGGGCGAIRVRGIVAPTISGNVSPAPDLVPLTYQ